MKHKVEEINLDLFKANTKPEYTHKRPMVYSLWHRTLKDGTYCTNVDWIEYRRGKIVAILEEKTFGYEISNWQKQIMLDLAKGLSLLYKREIPVYAVYHNLEKIPNHKEGWIFELINLRTNKIERMNVHKYKRFLESL